jgi:hypothetical protein
MLGRMSIILILAAGACQTGPGTPCGDGYCGVGYACEQEDGAWQCVRSVDGCAGACGSGCGDGTVDAAAGCDGGNAIAGDGRHDCCQAEQGPMP